MSDERAAQLEVKPRARIIASSVSGIAPEIMGVGPIEAVRKVLKQAGMSLDDVDVIELNEAFAAQALAVMKDLELDPAKVNPNGGAIALGHPLGCSGARLATTMVHHMAANGIRYGLQTICEAGGMANALILELLDSAEEGRA